ncbi:flavin reductase family protein [Plantactinospora sp. GCM10030261]|uniref:flavin reductase family protein n=1 Tax=Plantactinospora sp. GCM10030261 TaxID=3273420 RepID=UPI0036066C13
MNVQPAPDPEVTDEKRLRQAYGAFATGVTVVTVGGQAPHGMTANSFTTVSLDPPLVLVCVGRDAIMHHALLDTRRFAVSVLAADQEDVARHFADRRRPLGLEQFRPVEWLPGERTGAPLLAGAVTHFECALWRSYDGGDHTIFLGRLLTLDRPSTDDALLFMSGKFLHLDTEPNEVTV